MESRSLTATEAAVKIRSGKKWKKRFCVLQRLSPISSDTALLLIYKNVKCSLKSARKKRTVRLEGFYGLESGFDLDKEHQTLAIICHSCVAVIAFETDYALRSWELWLRDLFGFSCQYSVRALDLPSNFADYKNATLRLHLRDKRFCLVHQTPPSLVIQLAFRDLRRFGLMADKNFAIEAGTRAGTHAGVYIFRCDSADRMAWTFQMARDSRLNDYIANLDNYENVAVMDGRDEQTTWTSLSGGSLRFTSATSSTGDRFLIDPYLPKGVTGAPLASSSYDPAISQAKLSRPSDLYANNIENSDGTIRHQPKVKLCCSSSRHPPRPARATCESRHRPDQIAEVVIPRRARPNSVCEPSCSSSRKLYEAMPTGRPLSEIFPTAVPQAHPDQIMLPLPVPPSACSRCRNYVNQPFIDSLQYYYNIDHVVLALSKKSKCCDHVCAGKKPIDEQAVEENNKILLAATAKINSGKVGGDEQISVNVPSTDYAAMAPRGGLYVLMEPTPNPQIRPRVPMNVQRRHSEISVPPDDPLHMDERNVVTVPSGEASDIAVAKSGIIVKPFEPLVLSDKRISSTKTPDQCRRCVAVERQRSLPVDRSAPEKVLEERSSSNRRRNAYGMPLKSRLQQYSSYRPPKTEELTKAVTPRSPAEELGQLWRSASFAAQNVFRSSSRRTRTFFGALVRRASSVVLRRGGENRNSFADGSMDGRESRARSEPPIPGTDDHRSVSSLDRRYLSDPRKWQNSVDLDEVIYEGTSFGPSNTYAGTGSSSRGGSHLAQLVSKRHLVAPQRSLGTESTWSSDSNAYRTSRRSSNFRDPDVNGVFDSISIISEMVSDSDVFVNDVWQAKTGSSVRQEYMSASTVSPIRSGGTPNGKSFSDRNAIAEIRSKKMNESTRRRITESALAGSFSGYDGDRSSDSHIAYSCTAPTTAPRNGSAAVTLCKKPAIDPAALPYLAPPPPVVRRRIEKRTAAYSPPPPFDRALSPVLAKSDGFPPKKSASKRHAGALPPPKIEGEVFKFPPFPIAVDDGCAESTLLNYATLAAQDPVTPMSDRVSIRRSINPASPADAKPVEYAKIDELATQAARKAIISRHDEIRTLSDGEHSIDTTRSVPCPRSSVKGRRGFMLRRSLLRRRRSLASLPASNA